MNVILDRIYYIIFGLIVIGLAFFEYFYKKKKAVNIAFAFVLVVYVLFATLRANSVGLDTDNYSESYYLSRNLDKAKDIISRNKPEYLYYGLATLFSHYLKLPEFYFRLFYYSIIAVCIFFSLINAEHKTFIFAIFLFLGYFIMSFTGVRQSISMAITTLAVSTFLFSKLSKIKKYIFYYVLNIIAIGFHSSALIMLVIPLWLLVPRKKGDFIFALPILIFVPLIIKNGIYLASFYTYVQYGFASYRPSITYILTTLLVIVFYIFAANTKLSNFLNNKFKKIKFSYTDLDDKIMMIILISLAFLSTNVFSVVVTRYAMYFYLIVAYFIYKFVDCFQDKKLKIVAYSSILTFFFLYFLYSLPPLGLLPYKFG